MFTEFLYDTNEWVLFLFITIIYLLGLIIGLHIGNKHSLKNTENKKILIFILQISTLSLLALLLSFTFAMAAFHYEVRKSLIMEESNGIYTLYLRTKLLPEPVQQEMIELLRIYYKLRSEDLYSEYDKEKSKRFEKGAQTLQLQMWIKVVEVAKNAPQSSTINLLLESINNMVDLFKKREMAISNHVPDIIFYLLFLSSFLTLLLTGYSLGIERSHRFLPALILTALIIAVTIVIIDLNGPRGGLIKVDLSNISNIRNLTSQPESQLMFFF